MVATLPGRDPSARIVFEAHTDTAGVAGMTIPPFDPRLEDGRLYGRGACDTKAGVAAMMHAVASLVEDRLQAGGVKWSSRERPTRNTPIAAY